MGDNGADGTRKLMRYGGQTRAGVNCCFEFDSVIRFEA